MAALVTFGTMATSVRRRANIENQTGFLSDAEVREYLNYGIGELWDLLVKARAQEHYRKTATFNTSNGVAFYSYSTMGATDFFQLVSVDVTLGTNITMTARPYMEPERNRFKWYPGWFYNQPVYYRLIGGATSDAGGINFIPAPGAAYSVSINYYPVFTPFATNGSADSSNFDGINGWEEYAIWKAVAECKAKGDEDPTFARAMVMDMRSRIEGLASMRDAGSPERVHDVTVDMDPWGSE